MARIAEMGLFFVLAMTCITMGPHLSAGQVAPAPALDCSSELAQLAPCLGFLTNSSITNVVPTCCSGLANVSSKRPQCLCQLISPSASNLSAQLGINDTRAFQLPGSCGLTLNVASCAAVLGPASAPAPVAPVTPVPAPAPVVTQGPATPAPAISPASSLAPGPAPGAVSPSPRATSPSPSTTPVSSPTPLESPAPVADCSAVTTELVPCVAFLTNTASSPSSTCCTNLGKAVTTSKQCVCQIVESPSLGAEANTTRVAELPSLCSLSVSLSDCSSVVESPTGSAGPGSSPSGNDGRPAAATSLFMVISLCLATLAHAVLQ